MHRLIPALAVLAALVAVLVVPAAAEHEKKPRHRIAEAGFHGLGNKGFNTDIMPWLSTDDRVYAATGTWGTVIGPAGSNLCPSQDDPTGERSGVRIIEATDPANPVLVASLPTIPGAQNNDLKVARVPTVNGPMELLVHSLEPCGGIGIFHQIPGSPTADVLSAALGAVDLDQTGFQIYDVSDPANPAKLGAFNNGGIGTHNLWVFSQDDRSYVAAVLNRIDFGIFVIGVLQIVDITDPANPSLVGEWELADSDLGCPERGNDSAFCVLHDVTVSADGTLAYLSFWDAGLILLDLSEPAEPQLIGQALGQVQADDPEVGWLNEEGNTHAAVPVFVDGRHLVVVTDEDFTGGGEIGVTVNAPANLAGFTRATQWDATAAVTGQTADLVYAGTGCSSANYAGLNVAGKIALVDSFEGQNPADQCPTYFFKQKMDAAEVAGAIGLVQIDDNDAPSGGFAIESGIPGLEIPNSAGVPIRGEATDGDGVAVNVTLDRGSKIDPWGFMRVVDVSDPDPANWREVATFKAPHVEDRLPGAEDVFSAHNPVVGPDGRLYLSWYTDGARVLELSQGGAKVKEIAWFAPRPGDHAGDNDADPNGGLFEDNIGFWGSWPLCHPNGDLLIFNSDPNRGIYVLRAEFSNCPTP